MKKTTFATMMALAMTAAAIGQETAQISFETADKNGDGRVNREEASIVAGFDFARADTNLDASLSRPEYQAALNILDEQSPSGDTVKTSRDTERTALNRPEREAALRIPSPSRDTEIAPRGGEPTAQVSFETTDKNKDGRVNRKEASAIPGFDFSAADTNEDASLSRQEFRVALASALPRG